MSKTKQRGNGQGTAYRRGQAWEAQVVIGWRPATTPGGHPIPVKRRKSGFKTKRDALAYCEELLRQREERPYLTLAEAYAAWAATYSPRVGVTTMKGYVAAFKHFGDLQYRKIDTITAKDLQDAMDACTAGKRTHQMMKVVAGLIWGYAVDGGMATKDVTRHLYTGKGESVQREPLTDDEVAVIRQAIGKEPYAEYVFAMCYLGFRPGEFLALTKADYHTSGEVTYLVGGSKTDAGKNRRVPIPAIIAPIIKEKLKSVGTELLFPQVVTDRRGTFTGYKQMTHDYFRVHVFVPMMQRLGIAEGKVPYATRHTYSDKLKTAAGDDKSKAALMGHTDYDFTRRKYQSTELEDLAQVVNTLE